MKYFCSYLCLLLLLPPIVRAQWLVQKSLHQKEMKTRIFWGSSFPALSLFSKGHHYHWFLFFSEGTMSPKKWKSPSFHPLFVTEFLHNWVLTPARIPYLILMLPSSGKHDTVLWQCQHDTLLPQMHNRWAMAEMFSLFSSRKNYIVITDLWTGML